MNENQKYMLAIEEYGSISKAADMMHITQSGLSQRLKKLETELGCELFDRSQTPLKPTPFGETYLFYARRALDDESHLIHDMSRLVEGRKRHLSAAVSAPRCLSLLSGSIQMFYERQEGCTLTLITAGNPETVTSLLLDGSVELAILTPVHLEAALFCSQRLCGERQVLVTPHGYDVEHTVDARGTRWVELHDLAGHPFIMPTTRQYMDNLLRRMIDETHANINIVLNSCETELALRLVHKGMGVTIVPNTFVFGEDREGLDVYELKGLDGERNLYHIHRAGESLSDDAALLVDCVTEWLAQQEL